MSRREVTGRKPGVSADLIKRHGPPSFDPKEIEPTEHVEPTTSTPTPRLALSISHFCQAHSISEAFYYKLKKQGLGPREMRVGARTLISLEAAAAWRAERENASAEATEVAA